MSKASFGQNLKFFGRVELHLKHDITRDPLLLVTKKATPYCRLLGKVNDMVSPHKYSELRSKMGFNFWLQMINSCGDNLLVKLSKDSGKTVEI